MISTKKIHFYTIDDVNKNISQFNPELIIHYNMRSIKKHFLKLKSRINSLDNKSKIIICTEAWLTDTVNFIAIKGYNHFFNDSKINKSDGTVFHIKN